MGVESVVSLILEGKDEGMSDVLGDVDSGIGGVVGSLGAIAGVAGVGAVLLGIGSALSEMADMAGEADSALSNVQIRTGGTNEEMEALKDTIYDIRSSGLGDSFTDVADKLGIVQAVTKAEGDELQYVTEKALLLSDVWDADVTESVRASDTAMNNFQTTSEETFDAIVTGYQRTGDPAGDLLDTINEYSADFAEAGFEFEEFVGILVAGSEAGAFNLDKVADSVREFTTRVVDGSDSTWAALNAIGLGADNLYAGFQDGSITTAESLGLVISKLEAMDDPIAQDLAGVALFGSMWEDLGKEMIFALDSGVESLGTYQGAADEAFATATSGLQNQSAQLDAAKEKFQILVGEAILPFKLAMYESGVIYLEGITAIAESLETVEDLEDAYDGVQATLRQTVSANESLVDSYGNTLLAVRASDEVLVRIDGHLGDVGSEADNLRARTDLLNYAILLMNQGFAGTTEDLVNAAVAMQEGEAALDSYGATVADYTDAENAAALAARDRAWATEETTLVTELATIATDEAALAEERAAIAAERNADAEAYRIEQTNLASEAVRNLSAELASGYDASVGILERGGELASLNDVIRQTASESGFSALELAIMDAAIGDTSEEAIQAALKFEILKEGIQGLAQSAAEDGVVTQQEIQGIISGAQDLQTTLDEGFTIAFEEEGIDGVIATASEAIGELEAKVAEPYELKIDADAGDVTTAIETAAGEAKTWTEGEYSAIFGGDTTELEKDVGKVQSDIDTLTNATYPIVLESNAPTVAEDVLGLESALVETISPTYNVVLDSNAPDTKTAVDNLKTAVDGLAGRTYTFKINADTSGVPDWAIPHSPLPIHTAWVDFANEMDQLSLNPRLGGSVGAASAPEPAFAAAGGGGASLIIQGDVYVGDPARNQASAAFDAFLQNYLSIKERSNF